MSMGMVTLVLGLFFPLLMILIKSETEFVYEITAGLILIGIILQYIGRRKIGKLKVYEKEKMYLVHGKMDNRFSSTNVANYTISYEVNGVEYKGQVIVGRHSAQDRYLRNELPLDLLVPENNHEVFFVREMVKATEVCEI
jgi:hypothetical protein